MKLAAAALGAALLAGCAGSQTVYHGYEQVAPAEWRAVDASTGQIGDVEGLRALTQAFPDSGSVRLRLLSAQLRAEEHDNALESLRWLNSRGYVFSEAGKAQISQLLGEMAAGIEWTETREVAASAIANTVPAAVRLPESVVRNPVNGDLFVSSILERKLFRISEGKEPVEIGLHDYDDISGLAYHAPTGRVLAASGNVNGSTDEGERFSGILSIPAGTGAVYRYEVPEGVVLSDLAIGPDEDVFASDPLNGGLYKLRRGGAGGITTLVEPGTFRSPQGIAVDPSGEYLHVSDYRYGLARVEIATGEVHQVRLGPPLPIVLDGFDALFRHGDELIGIQNGTSPMRIVALKLADGGAWITDFRILEQANPWWTEPLGGSIDGDDLLYIGNGQWDVFNPDGSVKEGKQPAPSQIRRLPLD